jgi:hypothetical protein
MPHRQWTPITCPECGALVGYADDNAFRYPVDGGYIAIAPTKRSGQLVIRCACQKWFRTWDFTKPRFKVIDPSGKTRWRKAA